MTNEIEKPDMLVGKWFHSINEDGLVQWQGQIEGMPSKGLYLVQLFSWFMGEASDQVLVKLDEMRRWRFYDSAEDMKFAYEYRYSKPVP